ncbi:MAG: hypothetical protein K0V04_05840 [Deltaproteobacteria bacterium]|nr:hypothetical protein [Deltaproteobacteria bacterium]
MLFLPDQAYGNTGQDNTGGEPENSTVTTPGILLGDTLAFYSWNVDRGGDNFGGRDNKIIEIFDGAWTPIVNCGTDLNGSAALPMCQWVMGPRTGDNWDYIVLDTSLWSGQFVQIRITYDTVDPQIGFEQGWYINDLRVGECGPSSTH